MLVHGTVKLTPGTTYGDTPAFPLGLEILLQYRKACSFLASLGVMK